MRRPLRPVVLVILACVLAVACGSNSKQAAKTPTTVPVGPGTTAPALIPKQGGNLIMGTEAEVDGFDPTKNRWDNNGGYYAQTVFDPLTALGADGKLHPYLAQAVDHNADYTVWTITLRSGVMFSNGDPLTAADVVYDLKAVKASLLTGTALGPVSTITQTGPLTLDVKMSESWVPFPIYLAGQVGFIASPKQLADPNGSRHPIGTGPFIMKEWVPGDHFLATRNPNYWQKGLPYLNSIEYKPIIEEQSRLNSLKTGDIQLLHTADSQSILALRSDKSFVNVDDSKGTNEHAVSMVMLDTAKPPFDNLLARQVAAYATDRARAIATLGEPFIPQADSPFAPGSAWHVDNPGFPNYDLSKAKALAAQYQATMGHKLTVQLGTTNTAKTLADAQLIQDMWTQAGMVVNIVQVQQSQYISNALTGAYQAYLWIQFGDPDPDAEYVWWSSLTARPVGQLSLNFTRNKDPQIDADLATGRHSPDPAARLAAYQDISRRFAVDLPYIWLSGIIQDFSSTQAVQGLTTSTLPDGTAGYPGPAGFRPAALWLK